MFSMFVISDHFDCVSRLSVHCSLNNHLECKPYRAKHSLHILKLGYTQSGHGVCSLAVKVELTVQMPVGFTVRNSDSGAQHQRQDSHASPEELYVMHPVICTACSCRKWPLNQE